MKNSKKIKMALIVLLSMIVACCTISTKAFAGSTNDVLADEDAFTTELNENLIDSEDDDISDLDSMTEEPDESSEDTTVLLDDLSENENDHIIEADKYNPYENEWSINLTMMVGEKYYLEELKDEYEYDKEYKKDVKVTSDNSSIASVGKFTKIQTFEEGDVCPIIAKSKGKTVVRYTRTSSDGWSYKEKGDIYVTVVDKFKQSFSLDNNYIGEELSERELMGLFWSGSEEELSNYYDDGYSLWESSNPGVLLKDESTFEVKGEGETKLTYYFVNVPFYRYYYYYDEYQKQVDEYHKKLANKYGTKYTVTLKVGGTNTNNYTVSFDSNGGSNVNSQNVAYGKTVKKPSNPKKEGYIFDAWYKEPACINKWDFSKDKITENITLYADWIVDRPITEISVKYHTMNWGYKVGDEGLIGYLRVLYKGEDDYEKVYFGDQGVEVIGFDSKTIGVKNITIKYCGKKINTKIWVGLDPKDTPVSFGGDGDEEGAGFYSIDECVKAIKKLDRKNLCAVWINVTQNHTENARINIPKLSTDFESDNYYGTYLEVNNECVLTLSDPNIIFGDNGGITGKIRAKDEDSKVVVNCTYNKVGTAGFSEYKFKVYPRMGWGAEVISSGGVSFIGSGNTSLYINQEQKIIDVSKVRTLSSDYGFKVYGNINNVKMIEGPLTIYGNMTNVETIYDSITLKNPRSVNSIKTISSDNTKIILTAIYENGLITIPKLTVDSVGKQHKEYGEIWYEGDLEIKVVDENNDNMIQLPSGTPLIYRKTTNSKDLERIRIVNKSITGRNMAVYNDGKVVKAGAEFEVTDGAGNKVKYYQLQTAFDQMQKGGSYHVILDEDISSTSLKLPRVQLEELYIEGKEGNHWNIALEKTSSLTANYDFRLERVSIKTGVDKKGNPNKLTLNQNKGTLTIIDVYNTDGVSVKGNSKSTLILGSDTTGAIIKGGVSGFGKIYVNGYTWAGDKFSTNDLHIGKNAYIEVDKGHTITAKTVTGSEGAGIRLTPITDYNPKGFKPLELGIVNEDSDNKLCLTLAEGSNLQEGTQILNSSKANLDKFDISGIIPKDGREYTLWRKKPGDSKVYLKAK